MQALAPRDEKDVVEVVAAAISNGTPVDVQGGATRNGLGRPSSGEIRLSLSGCSGITLYEPSELVMSVRAGTPLHAVRDQLAQYGQELAFEPICHAELYGSQAEAQTMGGLFAVNASGPRRIKAGAARDHLLGFRAVNGRGETFKSGGRVMKNVTGYDMSKLMAGSFGTLGVLTELTFKVLPRPATEQTVLAIGLDDATAVREMTRITGLSLEVSSLAHLPSGVALPDGCDRAGLAGQALTCLRIEGPEGSTAERCQSLRNELGPIASRCETFGWSESRELWTHVRDVKPLAATGRTLWRISTAPAQGAALVVALKARGSKIAGHYYDWAGGLIWLALETEDAADALLLREETDRLGGHATLIRASRDLRAQVPVFHPQSRALADLTARVRRSFDPTLILNRGRLREDL